MKENSIKNERSSIKEDIKTLEEIIKGDEDCINAIYSQMKVKNDNDEDIQYFKKEIQSIKNIVNNYLKEKARADKLEKEYSAMLTESDGNECNYKRVLEMNEVLLKENELLRKDIEGWKKYCEEIEKDQTEMSNKNCELEFEVEKLQKENEKLKDFKKQVTEIESTNFIKYKNYISKQEVKDKIEKLNKKEQKLQNSISDEEREEYSDANISWDLMDINIKREVLQELIEESE